MRPNPADPAGSRRGAQPGRMVRPATVVVLTLAGLGLVTIVSCAAPTGRALDGVFQFKSLSTDPERVTGGDALVEISLPQNVAGDTVTVTLDGQDVTKAFRTAAEGTLTGLVTGLAVGEHTLAVAAADASRPDATLRLRNHPLTGPVFSGPHQTPFICETERFVLPVTGGTLGPPLDEHCSAATRVDYVYMPTSGTFKPLPDGSVRPGDLAETTTMEGRVVPYIVRVETGTINRAIYQMAILHDPTTEPTIDPWTRPAGWNGRLVYTFGGGYQAAYHQGRSTAGVLNPMFLSQGYAVASASLNVARNNSNDVTSAETAMMVKERFIEQFGAPRHTIGWGASGGAMQQHHIALNYPGILDGLLPGAASPDTVTRIGWVSDCTLLDRYFKTSDHAWTADEQTAVSGFATWEICTGGPSNTGSAWIESGYSPGWIDPAACDEAIPPALIYDRVKNPGGVRCTFQDNMINMFGRDPATGFARRPIDNVGVQYGLAAFNAGTISAEQFLELNERIGGFDLDAHIVAERTAGDLEAIRIAYETGRINTGRGGMAFTPIIDIRTYTDPFDFHDRVRTFATKARLIAANGHADNRVMLTTSPTATGAGAPEMVSAEALRLMDDWLERMARDEAGGSAAEKVVRNKPPDLVDGCYTGDGRWIAEPAVHQGPGACNELYPTHGDPRMVAGAGVAGDIMKCTLTPVDPGDYKRPLTSEQLERLARIFPDGVCDWSKPGVGQQPLRETWVSY